MHKNEQKIDSKKTSKKVVHELVRYMKDKVFVETLGSFRSKYEYYFLQFPNQFCSCKSGGSGNLIGMTSDDLGQVFS